MFRQCNPAMMCLRIWYNSNVTVPVSLSSLHSWVTFILKSLSSFITPDISLIKTEYVSYGNFRASTQGFLYAVTFFSFLLLSPYSRIKARWCDMKFRQIVTVGLEHSRHDSTLLHAALDKRDGMGLLDPAGLLGRNKIGKRSNPVINRHRIPYEWFLQLWKQMNKCSLSNLITIVDRPHFHPVLICNLI